jgi:hypothetical protein
MMADVSTEHSLSDLSSSVSSSTGQSRHTKLTSSSSYLQASPRNGSKILSETSGSSSGSSSSSSSSSSDSNRSRRHETISADARLQD